MQSRGLIMPRGGLPVLRADQRLAAQDFRLRVGRGFVNVGMLRYFIGRNECWGYVLRARPVLYEPAFYAYLATPLIVPVNGYASPIDRIAADEASDFTDEQQYADDYGAQDPGPGDELSQQDQQNMQDQLNMLNSEMPQPPVDDEVAAAVRVHAEETIRAEENGATAITLNSDHLKDLKYSFVVTHKINATSTSGDHAPCMLTYLDILHLNQIPNLDKDQTVEMFVAKSTGTCASGSTVELAIGDLSLFETELAAHTDAKIEAMHGEWLEQQSASAEQPAAGEQIQFGQSTF
jgi:hypothetical protein